MKILLKEIKYDSLFENIKQIKRFEIIEETKILAKNL